MNITPIYMTEYKFIDYLNESYEPITLFDIVYEAGHALHKIDPIAFNEMKNKHNNGIPIAYECGECEEQYETEEKAENCCKRSHLVDLLEKYGYNGIDASIEESLYQYGLVYNPTTNHAIISSVSGDKFDHTYIDCHDIKDALERMEDGFYSFVGDERRQSYFQSLEEADDVSLVHYIQDIIIYSSYFTWNLVYNMTIDDIITLLKNEEA